MRDPSHGGRPPVSEASVDTAGNALLDDQDQSFSHETIERLLYSRLAPVLLSVIGCLWLTPPHDHSLKPQTTLKQALEKQGGFKAVLPGNTCPPMRTL